MTYTTRMTCRVCGSSDLVPLFSLGEQYISDFLTPDTTRILEPVPIDIELCRSCTLVQAKHTAKIPARYWYRSGVTQTMRDALKDVALSAEKVVGGLKDGDVVLDIGANDGTLLSNYKPGVVRVAVEPAENLAEECKKHCDVFIGDFWGTSECLGKYAGALLNGDGVKRAKIVTALGMMYDMEDPNNFVENVWEVLAPDGVFVAQLMCLKQTVEAGDVGNFCHEHLEFYSMKSLHTLFEKHGLRIVDVEENSVNGGSYRLYARLAKDSPKQTLACVRAYCDYNNPDGTYEAMRMLWARAGANKAKCVEFIHREVAAGKKVWVYGASTKGNVILQWYQLDHSVIKGAADRSPEKWGLHTVGTGIPIFPESTMRVVNPDYLLVLPYAFRDEFLTRESEWRSKGGKFIFPLPTFEVV